MKKSRGRKNISIRTMPDEKLIFWREGFLYAMQFMTPCITSEASFFLEKGNSKIGEGNEQYSKVLVWNLPPVITCPSASDWCTKHCYNADSRESVFPISKWNSNWSLILNNISLVKNKIVEEVNRTDESVAFRIHSSGDFFSNDYINMWIDILDSCPKAKFWAYTRSWNDRSLLERLNVLKSHSNIQLFASWDLTMPEPPSGWRKSIVYNSHENTNYKGLICPEQSGKVSNCISCNFCIRDGDEDVLFILH